MDDDAGSVPGAASRPVARRGVRVAVALAVLVLGAESVLQLWHWLAWRHAWVGPAPSRAGVTLCAGGDLTFGLGASARDRAYPAVLERLLAERRAGARVVNAGHPARDSEAVLRALPEQLALESPSRVLVWLGDEVALARPAARVVDLDGLDARTGAFAWRVRLIDVFAASFAAPAPRDAGDLLGEWNAGVLRAAFTADGRFELGTEVARWSPAGDRLAVTLANGDRLDVEWRVDDGRLRLIGPFPSGELVFERGAPATSADERARAEFGAGRIASARWLLDVARAGGAPADATATLAELTSLVGEPGEASALAGELAVGPAANDAADTRAIARARLVAGDAEGALDLLAPRLAEHLADERTALALAHRALHGPQRERLLGLLGGLRSAPGTSRAVVARAAAIAAWQLAPVDAAAASASLGAALEADPELGEIWRPARCWPGSETGFTGPRADRARGLRADRVAVLERNLRAIVAVVRHYDAEPVLVLGLVPDDASACVERIGAELGVRCVAVQPGGGEVVSFAPLALTDAGHAQVARALSGALAD